ncbi:hypothetical protein J5500_03445 [Candidatus Saccharibacteria bacterium]|nr:hypothetical protein [Candidatus Saccharibacteria bacterium]
MDNSSEASTEKTKSNKGWMVAAIIAIIGVIALGVTEFLAYQDIAKKDDEIADLKKQVEDKTDQDALDLRGFDFDGPGFTKVLNLGTNTTGPDYEAQLVEVMGGKISKDGKYLYVEVHGVQGLSGFRTFVYRTLPDGNWKNIGVARNGVSECKNYSKEALEILIDYGNSDEECMSDNWKADDDLTKISDYYNEKYKEDK